MTEYEYKCSQCHKVMVSEEPDMDNDDGGYLLCFDCLCKLAGDDARKLIAAMEKEMTNHGIS